MLAVVVVELVVVVVVLAEKHVLNSCNKITIYIKFGTLYLLYGHLTINRHYTICMAFFHISR